MVHLKKLEASFKYSLVRNLEYRGPDGKVGVPVNDILGINFQCCMLVSNTPQFGECIDWGDTQESKVDRIGQDVPGILHSVLWSSVSNTE